MTYIEAHYIYELERQLPERNFAKGHSFEEWLKYRVMIIEPLTAQAMTQNATSEREEYRVEMLGTVPQECVDALKAELLAIGTRYGLTSKVRPVMALSTG